MINPIINPGLISLKGENGKVLDCSGVTFNLEHSHSLSVYFMTLKSIVLP